MYIHLITLQFVCYSPETTKHSIRHKELNNFVIKFLWPLSVLEIRVGDPPFMVPGLSLTWLLLWKFANQQLATYYKTDTYVDDRSADGTTVDWYNWRYITLDCNNDHVVTVTLKSSCSLSSSVDSPCATSSHPVPIYTTEQNQLR